jgi:hypothetical protein
MKTLLKRKMLFAWMLLLGSVGFIACTSDTLDLENISKNLQFGTNLQLPLIKEAGLSVDDLLEKVTSNNDIVVDIDEYEGVVALFYSSPPLHYNLNGINKGFGTFEQDMQKLNIADMFTENPVMERLFKWFGEAAIPKGTSFSDTIEFTLPAFEMEMPGSQKIKYMGLNNANITIGITTKNFDIQTDSLFKVELILQTVQQNSVDTFSRSELSLAFPLKRQPSTVKTFEGESFILDCSDGGINAKLVIKIEGDGLTKITTNSELSGNIAFALATDDDGSLAADAFTVWGWFNYVFMDPSDAANKEDVFPVKVEQYKEYLTDSTKLVFANPQLQFNIKSNLGIPMVFTILELTSKTETSNEEYSITKEYNLNQAKINVTNDTIFSMNKASLDETMSANYSNMFSTDLDSLKLQYKVATKTINLDNIDEKETPLQHLSSNGEITVSAGAVLPMTLGVGTQLAYSETVEVSYTEDIEFTGSLFIQYQNTLPLEMHITLTLLDENGQKITSRQLDMEKQEMNTNEWLPLRNKLPNGSYEDLQVATKDLKATKNIQIEYTSGKLDEEVSLRKDQELLLKVGAGISGSINVNLNDTEEI